MSRCAQKKSRVPSSGKSVVLSELGTRNSELRHRSILGKGVDPAAPAVHVERGRRAVRFFPGQTVEGTALGADPFVVGGPPAGPDDRDKQRFVEVGQGG